MGGGEWIDLDVEQSCELITHTSEADEGKGGLAGGGRERLFALQTTLLLTGIPLPLSSYPMGELECILQDRNTGNEGIGFIADPLVLAGPRPSKHGDLSMPLMTLGPLMTLTQTETETTANQVLSVGSSKQCQCPALVQRHHQPLIGPLLQ